MIEKLICTLPDRAEIHPFVSILNIGPRFKYLPKGSFYLFILSDFLYIAAVLETEGSKSPILHFFWLKFRDLQRPANQNNHRLYMTLCHR